MTTPSPINPQLTGEVTQTNVPTQGETPAQALASQEQQESADAARQNNGQA